MAEKPTIEVALTQEQKEQIRQATGKEVRTLKLEPLETRLAPRVLTN
jgi:hypothetical protein